MSIYYPFTRGLTGTRALVGYYNTIKRHVCNRKIIVNQQGTARKPTEYMY